MPAFFFEGLPPATVNDCDYSPDDLTGRDSVPFSRDSPKTN